MTGLVSLWVAIAGRERQGKKLALVIMSPVKAVLLEESQIIVIGRNLAIAAGQGPGGREDNLGSIGSCLGDGALDGVGDNSAGNGTENGKDGLGEHDE